MKLPERAGPLLDALAEFSRSEAMRAFRASARERFCPDEIDDPRSELEFEDYVRFTHRDDGGRSVVDHFLASRSSTLEPDLCEAYLRIGHSEFGAFRVEKVVPGAHVVLRPLGGDREIRVVDIEVSRSVVAGAMLCARLVPFRDAHEFGTPPSCFPAETAYSLERRLDACPPDERARLTDPVLFYEIARKVRVSPLSTQAESRFEAELLAEVAFREAGLSSSVEEVQELFRDAESPMALMKELALEPFTSDEQATRFMTAWFDLWNHTPRPEFDGKTPHEMGENDAARKPSMPEHLAQDLMRTVAASVDPEAYSDDESRREAMRAVEERWFETPQRELGGRTPRNVLECGEVPPLPAEATLPPADVPLHSLRTVEQHLENAASRPYAAIWALELAVRREWIDELDRESYERAIADLLGPGCDASRIEALCRALEDAPDAIRRACADSVTETIERSEQDGEDWELDRYLTLSFLAHALPAERAERLRSYADHPSPLLRSIGLEVLSSAAREGDVTALSALEAISTDDRVLDPFSTLSALLRSGDASLVERSILRILGRGRFRASLDDLISSLHAAGLSFAEVDRAEWALFPGRPSRDDDELDARAGAILPVVDPPALERARRMLPPDQARELLRAVDRRPPRECAERMLALASEALRALGEEDRVPSRVKDRASILAAVLRAVGASRWQSHREVSIHRSVSRMATAILAWAIRGRDLEDEWQAIEQNTIPAAERAERVKSICLVDTDWLDQRRLAIAADLVPVAVLHELAAAPDAVVSEQALAVLAVVDPHEHLARAFQSSKFKDWIEIGAAAAARHGDAILAPLVDWIRNTGMESEVADHDERREAFESVLGDLGTRRAVLVARRYLESATFHRSAPPMLAEGFALPLALGEPALLELALEKLEAGAIDLLVEADCPEDRDEAIEHVATALELLGRDDDPREFFDAAIERYETEHSEDASEYDDAQDGEYGLEDPIPFGIDDDTFRRDAPKVGRNDPCPCGSGRKFKKCCGG